MLYAVLGAVAQFEGDVLREGTVAGMRAAKSAASTSVAPGAHAGAGARSEANAPSR